MSTPAPTPAQQAVAAYVASLVGKPCSFPGVPAGQCVAPVQLYATTIVKAPPFVGAGAINFFTTYSRAHYQAFTPAGHTPAPGDVVLWGQNTQVGTGPFGHCAVVVAVFSHDAGFSSLDQNWPPGSVCHLQNHDYVGVVGWLRPLPPPTPPPTSAQVAVRVLTAHAAALTTSPSVAATNALVKAIGTWPVFAE